MEDLVKDKEKDLEKAEERGNALIQNKKGEACSVVKETLKGLNRSWAHLDHMVSFCYMCLLNFPTHLYKCYSLFSSDRSDEGEPAVSAGAVDSVPASFRRNKRLPDGGEIFCVQAPTP